VAVTLAVGLTAGCTGGAKKGQDAGEGVTEERETTSGDRQSAADFTLQDIDGKSVTLLSFKGKVVILDFFATWCPPCRKGIPEFVELYNTYKESGFVMLGLAVDGPASVVKSFAGEMNINYPVLMANEEVQKAYGGIRSIPTTFVLDRNLKIVNKYVGYQSKDVFEQDIKGVIGK
jgi:cytochrome c biogenesis protein CcmG/thiol:disulfide interchange protein DsbE